MKTKAQIKDRINTLEEHVETYTTMIRLASSNSERNSLLATKEMYHTAILNLQWAID